jgi:hypothetical protein
MKHTRFKNLPVGTCFIYANDIYIKSDMIDTYLSATPGKLVVNLKTGKTINWRMPYARVFPVRLSLEAFFPKKGVEIPYFEK